MSKANPIVAAFNAGRLGPRLQARVDLVKYQAGCTEIENFVPTAQGPAVKRSGTRHVVEAKYSDKNARLVQFEYSREQAYVLEFGHEYVRFYRNNAPVLEDAKSFNANPTAANPVVITSNLHGFANGDLVYVTGADQRELNDRYFTVAGQTTDTFELTGENGTGRITGSAGTVSRVYTLTTNVPYQSSEVAQLAFEQSNDVLYIVHANHPPAKLGRIAATNWTYTTISGNQPPFNIENDDESITVGASASTGTAVVLTASSAIFKHSMVGSYVRLRELYASIHPKWQPQKQFVKLGSFPNGVGSVYSDGRVYSFAGQDWWRDARNPEKSYTGTEPPVHDAGIFNDGKAYSEWEFLNEGYGYGKITHVNSTTTGSGLHTTCTIDVDTDGIFLPASTVSSGYTYQPAVEITEVSNATTAVVTAPDHNYANGDTVFIEGTSNAVLDGNEFVVSSADISAFTFALTGADTSGVVAVATTGTAQRRQAGQSTSRWTLGAWADEYGYPSSVGFFQDRLFFGGTTRFPQSVWGSAVGDYENFQSSGEHAEGLDFTIHNEQQNAIQWLIGNQQSLFIGTLGGEFTLSSQNGDEALSRDNFQLTRRSKYGCREGTQAKGVDAGILFAQRSGQKLHELQYQFESDSYVAPDLTALSEDILVGGLQDMVLQHEPYRLLWCITEDGKLRTLTYERSQEVTAWATYQLGGSGVKVLSVAVIPHPDGDQDQVWFLIERTINGASKRYIEYLERPWEPTTARSNARFLDSALSYSGTTSEPFVGLVFAGTTLTALLPANTIYRVGDFIRFTATSNGVGVGRVFQIASSASASIVSNITLVEPSGGSISLNGIPSGTPGSFEFVTNTVTKLEHLEGESLEFLVDGQAHIAVTVSGGSATLNRYGNRIEAGLPFVAKLQTMRLEVGATAGTAQGKTKRINRMVVRLDQTGPGLEYGVTFDTMDRLLPSVFNAADIPQPLITGDTERLTLPSGYDKDGRIAVRHAAPQPATIVGLFPMLKTEEGG
jgi:hypothetical protein